MTNEEIVMRVQKTENKEEKRDLYEVLYEQNTGLIGKIAARYAGFEDMEDLKQQAFFGIVKAAERYDPEVGASFATYAFSWIRVELNTYIQDCGRMIRIPAHELNLLGKYRRLVSDYEASRGRRPTEEETCYLLDISYKQLKKLQKVDRQIRVRSINEPIPGSDDLTLADALPDPEDRIQTAEDRILRSQFWEVIDMLPKDEARSVKLKYKDGLTRKEIAEQMERTENQVQGILDKAFRKLRSGKLRNRLASFILDEAESSGYSRSGLAAFRRSGNSSVEAVILEAEKYENLLLARENSEVKI